MLHVIGILVSQKNIAGMLGSKLCTEESEEDSDRGVCNGHFAFPNKTWRKLNFEQNMR